MKKLYTLFLILSISIYSFGQFKAGIQRFDAKQISVKAPQQFLAGDVYYSQDFEDYTEGDMTFIDNDGLTPHANVAAYTSNWSVIEGAAYTTSWLTDGNKTSDNWMITPLISLGTDAYLTWDAIAIDPSYADGYEVFISTSGNSISDFTTSLFSISNEQTEWTSRLVDLVDYNGQDVYIAFHHNSTDMYLLAVDNIKVSQLDGFDVSLESAQYSKYIKVNENSGVSFTIANNKIDTLRTATLNYQIDDNPVQSFDITTEMVYGNTETFTHEDSISIANAGKYDIKFWISNQNGGVDDDNSNDTLTGYFYAVNSTFEKNVILEEYTGAWCGWCPDGSVIMEELLANYSNLIGVCAHAGDVMDTEQTLEVTSAVGTAYPGGCVDRFKFSDADLALGRNLWEEKIMERLDMAVPAEVDFTFTYNESTREITIDASAQFSQAMSEDFRLNCYVIEDNVDKDDPAYNQTNYYSGMQGQEAHPYYNQPDPVTDYIHKHVVREMLGGSWGMAGSIPASVESGQEYTHQFTHTLSADFNADEVYLVVVIQEYDEDVNKREIHNAKELKLTDGGLVIMDENGETINHDETITVTGHYTDYEVGVILNVKNHSGSEKTVKAEKEVIEMIDGTTNTFCWAGNCYSDEITESTSNSVIGAGEINTEFRADIAPDGNIGIQKMRYTFTNVDDSKDFTSINVNFNIVEQSGLEMTNDEKQKIKYGPNPIYKDGVLKIDFSEQISGKSTIRLYDNTSRLVLTHQVQNINGGTAELSLNQHNLSAGTYFLIIATDKENMAVPVIILE